MNPPAGSLGADFLGHLVALARGSAGTIAPRLPSLFEPISPAYAPEETDAGPAPLATAPSAPDAAGTAPHAKQPAAKQWATPHHDQRGSDDVQPDAARRSDRVAPVTEPAAGPAPVAVPPAPLARPTVLLPVPTRQGGVERNDASEPLPRVTDRTAPPLATREEPAASIRRSPGGTGPAAAPAPAPKPVEGALLPQPVAVALPRTTLRPDAGPPPRVPEPEQAGPVINVTIGRVEVRAVPAAPARPRAEGMRPTPLSLDDYLKQRGGGR